MQPKEPAEAKSEDEKESTDKVSKVEEPVPAPKPDIFNDQEWDTDLEDEGCQTPQIVIHISSFRQG